MYLCFNILFVIEIFGQENDVIAKELVTSFIQVN